MSLLSSILEKLGLGQAGATSASKGNASSASPSATTTSSAATTGTPVSTGWPSSTASGTPPQSVDVAAKLDKLAASNGQKLNWKTSIVDLLKLLDLDSSLESRKKLAHELGYTGSTDDSAAMNIWLHREVMNKLAANGGNVPKELLHG